MFISHIYVKCKVNECAVLCEGEEWAMRGSRKGGSEKGLLWGLFCSNPFG